MAVIFPYDVPIYVGTVGTDFVDDLLADNPFPFNPGDGGDRPTVGANGSADPFYPVAFLNGTNVAQPDPDGFAPVFFIVYSATFRVEVHGRFTGVDEGDPVFGLPAIIAPGYRVPIHGSVADFSATWRGYIDADGTVFYMAQS